MQNYTGFRGMLAALFVLTATCLSAQTSADLTARQPSALPAGAQFEWRTAAQPAAPLVSNPGTAGPGIYYGFINYGGSPACYSAPAVVRVLAADCPSRRADLRRAIDTLNIPAGQVLSYHSAVPASLLNRLDAATYLAAPAGIYYIAYLDTAQLCFSTASPVIVLEQACQFFAENDVLQALRGFPVSANLLLNDYSPSGDSIAFGSLLSAGGQPLFNGQIVPGLDVNGNPFPSAGTISFDNEGNITFIPNPAFVGTVNLSYSACSGSQTPICDTAAVRVQVIDQPYNANSIIVQPDAYFSFGDTLRGNILDNDADPQGDAIAVLSYLIDSNGDGLPDQPALTGQPQTLSGVNDAGEPVAAAATFILQSDGSFILVPDSGFTGVIRLQHSVCDDVTPPACGISEQEVRVLPQPLAGTAQPPFAGNDFAFTLRNTPVSGNFAANDGTPDGRPLLLNNQQIQPEQPVQLLLATTTVEGGSLQLFSDGSFQYTPAAGFIGADRYVYTVCNGPAIDPQTLCKQASIQFLTGSVNTAFATDDLYATFEQEAVSGNVTVNDFDAEGHVLSFGNFLETGTGLPLTSGVSLPGISESGQPTGNAGVLLFDDQGNFTFTPSAGFTGSVTIPYYSCDNAYLSACDTALLQVSVNLNDLQLGGVIAQPDVFHSINPIVNGNTLLNDADILGRPLTVTGITYSPDGIGEPATPATPGTPVIIGGKDINGNPVSNAGTLLLLPDGSFVFQGSQGFAGTVKAGQQVCNDATPPQCANTTLEINILPDNNGTANDFPIVGDDFVLASINGSVSGNFLLNDFDLNGDPLTLNGLPVALGAVPVLADSLTTEQGGTLLLYTDGSFIYTPAFDFMGEDKASYTICDVSSSFPGSLCATATIHMLTTGGIIVKGQVWHDINGSVTQETGEVGTTANALLFINVTNGRGITIASTTVNTDGSYLLTDIPARTRNELRSRVSTQPVARGTAAPEPSLPAPWVFTGQSNNGELIFSPRSSFGGPSGWVQRQGPGGILPYDTDIDTLTNLDFGIEIRPMSMPFSTSLVYYVNEDSTILNPMEILPSFFNTGDADGKVDSVLFSSYPEGVLFVNINGVAYTAATWPVNGITVPVDTSGNPIFSTFQVFPNTSISTSVLITFQAVDNANQLSLPTLAAVNYNAILPVELTSFDVSTKNCEVLAKWSTASELNNDVFILHRSLNATDWTPVAEIRGAGTTNTPQYYEWWDRSAPAGLLYYRLKQRDYDGTEEWLPVRSVDLSGCTASSILIWPNPANNTIFVKMTAFPAQKRHVLLFNAAGLLIMAVDGNTSDMIELDVRSLPAGSYMVQLLTDSDTYTEKVVIMH